MNFRPLRAESDFRIELTPLIDVIFQLLIFFMLTTTFVTQRSLDVQLPQANAQPEAPDTEVVVVSLTRGDQIAVNGTVVGLPELEDRFRSAAQAVSDPILVVRADAQATHGRVVKVMDLARLHGISKLSFATAPLDD